MIEELNQRLNDVKRKLRNKEKWEAALKQNQEEIQKLQFKLEEAAHRLKKEEKDVDRLEKVSLQNFVVTLLGKKLERMEKEKQELVEARISYDEARQSLDECRREIEQLQARLAPLKGVDEEYRRILHEKEVLIRDQRSPLSRTIYELSEKEAKLRADIQEMNEAIRAGDQVVEALTELMTSLEKARGWGTFDMLGGGLLATMAKHGHLDDARHHVHRAQTQLKKFNKELQDVNLHLDIVIDIKGLLAFADYLFDGFLVDWVVQGRINEALDRTEEHSSRISTIINDLEMKKIEIEGEVERLSVERIRRIEQAGNE